MSHEQFSHGENGEGFIPKDYTLAFAAAIDSYLEDAERNSVLRPYQQSVFFDFRDFFAEGQTRGYIELPTGTGKTVLFVEATKALLGTDESRVRPKFLVVTATKDLVIQTRGASGEKGYGRFAPDLQVGTYFSDTPSSQKTAEALDTQDVVVTTYDSFKLLARRKIPLLREEIDENELQTESFRELEEQFGFDFALNSLRYARSHRRMLDMFQVIFFDEAHHLFGRDISDIVTTLPAHTILIGFTATPDVSEADQLINILSKKIHTLDLKEAIWMGLLAPLVPLGIKSGIQVRGTNLYNQSGEFIDSRIRSLAEDLGRNRLVIDTAKTMAQAGLGTIVSCIAGDEALHARYLASQLAREGVRAAAVYEAIPAKERQKLYRKFEQGDIDVLTFIGVLGEGWDSTRAKALINARPTRSPRFAEQRLGRVTRPGGVAFAVDIVDEFDEKNPAITVTDVLNDGNMPYGNMLGNYEDTASVHRILGALQNNLPVMDMLYDNFEQYQQLLAELPATVRGKLRREDIKSAKEYAVAARISTSYKGVTDEIFTQVEHLTGKPFDKRLARKGNAVVTVYNTETAWRVLADLPEVNPLKYYIDENRSKYITVEGLLKLFGKKYPALTVEIAQEQLEMLENSIPWVPVKYRDTETQLPVKLFRVAKMYRADDESIHLLKQAIETYFTDRSHNQIVL